MGLNSFKPSDLADKNDTKTRRWLIFDPLLDDEALSNLMSPLKPVEIDRKGSLGRRDYYGKELDYTDFRQKEAAWLKNWHQENDPRIEAERKKRFDEYYKSLNLDPWIEIPGIASYPDGRQEQIMYRSEV